MRSDATGVKEYIDSLPHDRRRTSSTVRKVVLDNLPAGYEEVMQHGMISYVVPKGRFERTYNGQPLAVASLASQKHHKAPYLMGTYGDDDSQTCCISSGQRPASRSTSARAACASRTSTTSEADSHFPRRDQRMRDIDRYVASTRGRSLALA